MSQTLDVVHALSEQPGCVVRAHPPSFVFTADKSESPQESASLVVWALKHFGYFARRTRRLLEAAEQVMWTSEPFLPFGSAERDFGCVDAALDPPDHCFPASDTAGNDPN